MQVRDWLDAHGGIAHRRSLARAGHDAYRIRRAGLETIGRNWVLTDRAPPLLRRAATHGSPLTCASAAEHLGLGVLEPTDRLHLWRPAHANSRGSANARVHRAALVGEHLDPLVVPILDVLAHAATCLPRREALVVWESGLHHGLISPAALRAAPWQSRAARECARVGSPLSESPLETVLLHGMLEFGLPVQQQVSILGHRVDFLIGSRLVIQADGYEFHRDARQRRSDIAHDAALRLHDYTTFRFDFVQVVRRWPETIGRILGAVDRGLHR
ncbi:MAG TPA: DUF559 domain-containing protein [Microbacteriaceae bacterium]|nr:DUF559 domain-containing protein [Microbacteriaceae bacterium]